MELVCGQGLHFEVKSVDQHKVCAAKATRLLPSSNG
jgi:hypothetical protein